MWGDPGREGLKKIKIKLISVRHIQVLHSKAQKLLDDLK